MERKFITRGGHEVADANELHYVNSITELLHGISRFGDIGTGNKAKRGDPDNLRYKKLSAIALKAVREAKGL